MRMRISLITAPLNDNDYHYYLNYFFIFCCTGCGNGAIITKIKQRGYAMTTIISLYLFAFLFLVAFGALAFAFTNYMTRKIPSAPGATKGANNEAKRLD